MILLFNKTTNRNYINCIFFKNLNLIFFWESFFISFIFNGLNIHLDLKFNLFLSSFLKSKLLTTIISESFNIFEKNYIFLNNLMTNH